MDLVQLSKILPKEAQQWDEDETQLWLNFIKIEEKYKIVLSN